MEMQQLNELIKNPDRLGDKTLGELRSLIDKYPYFQTAWVLYLKNLFLVNHPSFRDELRRGAVYIADLSVLFYYIEGSRFVIYKHEVSDRNGLDDTGDRTLDLIDRFLSELSDKETLSNELPLPVESAPDYTSVLLKETHSEEDESIPMKGQDLIDSFIEKSDCQTEELFGKKKDASDMENQEPVDTPSSNELEVKDRTLITEHEENEDEEYLTETLAKIYVKQQRYDKALEIIKKLYLKYPKKNVYFADQIRFLEKLIINAKSK